MTDIPNVQSPKTGFPCEHYPIKMIGNAGEGLPDLVVEVIQRHAPDPDVETLVVCSNSKGHSLSIQVLITAIDVDQL